MEFEDLVKKFSPHIRRLANRTIIYSQVIGKEDLFQEMLLSLWKRWRKGELGDKTDAYIVKSCYFHLKNYLRRFREKAKIMSLNEPLGDEMPSLEELIPDPTPLFDQRVDDVLFIQKMKDEELTRREKEVAELLGEGCTLREIGKELGISHVRVLRIRENIGKKFKKGGYQKG